MRFFLAFLMLLISSSATADIHMSLSDKSFYRGEALKVSYDGVDLDIRVYHEKSSFSEEAYSDSFVKQVAKQTMMHLFRFLKLKRLNRNSCGLKPQRLNIYVVSNRLLNDRNRFSLNSLENQGLNKFSNIVGYYDPTHYDGKTDSIILTNLSRRRNNILLAHEISHYFYNRFCIKTQTFQETEPFAVEFQDYYSRLSDL